MDNAALKIINRGDKTKFVYKRFFVCLQKKILVFLLPTAFTVRYYPKNVWQYLGLWPGSLFQPVFDPK
jgi:hypothetical protein